MALCRKLFCAGAAHRALAAQFGVSIGAIYCQMSRMDLRRSRDWRKEDDVQLLENPGNLTSRELGVQFGVTADAIRSRICRLKSERKNNEAKNYGD